MSSTTENLDPDNTTGTSGTVTTTSVSTTQGNSGPGSGDATSGGTDDSTKDEKTLSQEEVNAIVAREVAKAQRGKLDPKELGFESGKELKDFLDQAKQKFEADKDEGQKQLEAAIEEARTTARQEVLSQANQRLVKAEFMLAAANAGIKFGEDAFALAQTTDLWTSVEVDDEGQVSGFDDAFFAELKTQKPYLFEEAKAKIPDAGAGAHGEAGEKNSLQELAAKYPSLRGAVNRS